MKKENIIWQRIPFPDDFSAESTSENDEVYYKIGNYVKKELIGINDEDTEILLSYPVVYFHTWMSDEGFECYIGETIDLLRRTEEHEKAGEDFSKWQSSWINGSDRISYYFSSKSMNKSMSLDLEDCLIRFLYKAFADKDYYSITRNGRQNQQPAYSNKSIRNELLRSMWSVIEEDVFKKSEELNSFFDIDKFISSNPIEELNLDDSKELLSNNFLFFRDYHDFDEILKKIQCDSFAYKNWPVVYLHLWTDIDGLHIYIGEANDVYQRTDEHITEAKKIKGDWHTKWGEAIKKCNACMVVIGHKQFNKSITLDLENMLYEYADKLDLMPDHTTKIFVENGRGNEQRRYDNECCLPGFFENVVNYLSNKEGAVSCWLKEKNIKDDVFKSLKYMRENSIFMASTMNKLSSDQLEAKQNILEKINETSDSDKKRLLIIKGGWGTGKTVVASSLFFDLLNEKKNVYFIMNHDQLMDVYKNQAVANDIGTKRNNGSNAITDRIIKAETAITKDDLDIVIIDEGHLLFEKNNNGKGEQLKRILEKAKTVVLLYDPDQHMDYVTMYDDVDAEFNTDEDLVKHFSEQLQKYSDLKEIDISVAANLTYQFRMDCSDETINWLKSLTIEDDIIHFPFESEKARYVYLEGDDYNKISEYDNNDKLLFEIYVVKSLCTLDRLILKKKENYDSSCLLSTYNYYYDQNNKTVPGLFLKNENNVYHGWHLTGNGEVWFKKDIEKETEKYFLANTRPKDCSKNIEGEQSYYEVGSVHDIQGFDLEYAGVMIGESWKYDSDKNKVTIDLSKAAGKNHQNDGNGTEKSRIMKKKAVSNELGVLLSRGKRGIVIYAVDNNLRDKLIEATKPNH
jgi:hypothetical protein